MGERVTKVLPIIGAVQLGLLITDVTRSQRT
jgi:hypothetical protein